ncbi:MAG: hypothetical protein JWR67_2198 [Mucilaginibacter sp.]|nr:hypothetical protein [Mucilaginibacter sp.]
MVDNNTLIEVSAFSGLAGALLTQLISGLFTYFSNKRKYNIKLKNQYRNKKVEVGENFYFMNGERMAMVKKNIAFWKSRNNIRSESGLSFLNKERDKLNAYITKLNAENWKYNLINLYFNVSLSNNDIIEANVEAQTCFLKILDIADKLKKAVTDEEKDELFGLYSLYVFNLCAQYEDIYLKMEQDMNVVKHELSREFGDK